MCMCVSAWAPVYHNIQVEVRGQPVETYSLLPSHPSQGSDPDGLEAGALIHPATLHTLILFLTAAALEVIYKLFFF